jgi:hypothetical protein
MFWTVICYAKEITDGRITFKYPLVSFNSRIVAEEYVHNLLMELTIKNKYVAGFITHPIYGRFLLDPSYWDVINMNKRVING